MYSYICVQPCSASCKCMCAVQSRLRIDMLLSFIYTNFDYILLCCRVNVITAIKFVCANDIIVLFTHFSYACRHIRSRPGFKYKDHGLPDNNAFWPGALLDKLRLWMPNASLNKSSSVDNIFQPVTRTKFSNPLGPVVEQKSSWPENGSGYVQFGSQNRKQYTI